MRSNATSFVVESMSTNKAQIIGREGGRKRKAPRRYEELSPTSIETDVLKKRIKQTEEALLDSEINLRNTRDLLSMSECMRTECEIEISRNVRVCAEWRALYYTHVSHGFAFQKLFFDHLHLQNLAKNSKAVV